MRIIRALFRFYSELIVAGLSGLIYILFDGEEVTEIFLQTRKRKDFYIIRNKIIKQHFEKCLRKTKEEK